MAGITTTTGLGSGIDINSLVQQLVTSEGQPQFNAINSRISAVQTKLSGLGSLSSALSTFQTAVQKLKSGDIFQANTATSSDETIAKVTAGTGSVSGAHTLEVQSLAKVQNSITTAEFTDFKEVVGTGTLTFAVGSKTPFSITLDSSNNTLEKVRDAINNASDNNGVVASLVNVDNATSTGTISKLVLTAKDPGTANAFTVTGTDGDGNNTDNSGISRLFSSNLSTTAASNAVVKIDGQTATRSTNSINDILQGITFNLQSAAVGKSININVNVDTKGVTDAINGFINAYNSLHSTTNNLGKFGGTGASATGNGPLLGDSTLRLITSQLRQDASSTVSSAPSNYNSLAQVGINIDKTGVISLDSSKLTAALTNNPNALADVFSSSNGVATRLDARLQNYLQSGGTIKSQQTSLNSSLNKLNDRTDAVQRRLDSLQVSLQKQFIALDQSVAQFKATGTFLTKEFG
ncbi:MAG: flagellar filament capping protein FliD [Methylococcaceae bacterium]|jgi:flagellar hook-associated protein 2